MVTVRDISTPAFIAGVSAQRYTNQLKLAEWTDLTNWQLLARLESMNIKHFADTALGQLDNIGFQLDEMGITDKVNRHTIIAFAMNEQQRLQGELDSLKARVGSRKVQVNRLITRAENLVNSGVELALTPARFTIETVKSKLNKG